MLYMYIYIYWCAGGHLSDAEPRLQAARGSIPHYGLSKETYHSVKRDYYSVNRDLFSKVLYILSFIL